MAYFANERGDETGAGGKEVVLIRRNDEGIGVGSPRRGFVRRHG